MRSYRTQPARRVLRAGVTMIELLAVLVVLLLLLGVAVPRMKPVLDRGRVREAARQVNAYFAASQARATQLGRPSGVWIERREDGACLELSPAEIPSVYSGDFLDARVRCSLQAPDQTQWGILFNQHSAFLRQLWAEHSRQSTIRNIDPVPPLRFLIRFDYRGPLYSAVWNGAENVAWNGTTFPIVMLIEDVQDQSRLDAPIADVFGAERLDPPLSAQQGSVPYQLFQLPRKTSGRTLQLTGGAVIDLFHSGYGHHGQELNVPFPGSLVVLFSPDGGVDSVTAMSSAAVVASVPEKPVAPLHFLIGRLDGSTLPTQQLPYNENLTNPDSIWISVGHRTGLITSSPNSWQLVPFNEPSFPLSLAAARELARTSQTLGGG